ncbi:MAG: restriction endonuclease subunit S [Ruminococcus sp.]|nr:restriction endonuclease subunit S [Ruminococcus sp.]
MSELNKLLNKLCPDGVEYVKIGNIATVSRGIRVVREQLKKDGEIPVYQNSLKPLGYHEKFNCPADTTFIIGAGAAGEIGYSTVNFWAADDCYYFICPETLDSRYLYFIMENNKQTILSKVRKASIPRLSRTVIENLVIPFPPVEVQREIVRILDNFTEIIELLKRETDLRQKQYEYYRDKLLTFKEILP